MTVAIFIEKHSDNDQQKQTKRTTPVQFKEEIESTSFELNLHSPPTSHRRSPTDQKPIHRHEPSAVAARKKKSSSQQDIQNYDNLENIAKSQRKHRVREVNSNRIEKSQRLILESDHALSTRGGHESPITFEWYRWCTLFNAFNANTYK